MISIAVSFFILIATLCLVRSGDCEPQVKTPLGNIKGFYKKSHNGHPYEVYQGIPYAQPPTGERRFKAPKPITAWTSELQATKLPQACLQFFHSPAYIKQTNQVKGSEDCLYLNIYVPKPKNINSGLPVIFWIHEGAFMYDSGNEFGVKYLMDKNVIIATVNYRLGPLGFLSTEDDVVTGNMGLKDQSLALRWVHENIQYFGGDPKRITLIGLSAGGASVQYHYFSPLSAGLFQNGFSISGTALNCWSQTENALEKARKLGALVDCPTESTTQMIACMKTRPAELIVRAVKHFMPWLYNPFTPFGPVVEKKGEKPFINRSPFEKLKSGDVLDVPWMMGLTSEEGLYPVADFATDEVLLKELNDNWTTLAPHLLDYNFTIPWQSHAEIAMKIRKHYLGSKPINGENIKQIIKMFSHRLYMVDGEKAARMQAKANKSPIWFYYYTYKATSSLSELFSGTKIDFGVSHADDFLLVSDNNITTAFNSISDDAMRKTLLHLWTSFAVTGHQDLSAKWKRVDPSQKDLRYLQIFGPDSFQMSSDKNFGEKQFWNSINFAENRLDLTKKLI